MAAAAREHAVGDRAGGRGARAVVRSVLLAGLPHDELHRLGAGVWFAFLTKATVWPELAAVVRSQLDGARDFVAGALRNADADGSLRPHVDPDTEAAALLALADGLVLRVMVGSLSPQTAVAIVDARLAQVLDTPLSTHG